VGVQGYPCVDSRACQPVCSECGSEVPINRRMQAKTCLGECQKKRIKRLKAVYYQENKEEAIAFQKEWHRKNPAKSILVSAKTRANRNGLEFNLTLDDIQIPEYCPILNILLGSLRGSRTNNTPSLDRIDNSKGYVKGNVHVVSWIANRLKGIATLEQLSILGQWAEQQQRSN